MTTEKRQRDMRGLAFFLLILLLPSVFACNKAGGLSDQDAINMIKQAKGYPKLVSISLGGFKADSPLGREAFRLIKEGSLIMSASNPFTGAGCRPTAKGQDLVERCYWNPVYQEWEVFNVFAFQEDVTHILDKRIDKDTATVEYENTLSPVPYFESLKQIDERSVTEGLNRTFFNNFRPNWHEQSQFQKWEKGWRLVQ